MKAMTVLITHNCFQWHSVSRISILG